MGHPKIFSTLHLSCFLLLILCISSGFGVETAGHAGFVGTSVKESGGKSRKVTIELMDYADTGPNTNTRSGYLSPPPPAPV